MNVSQLHNKKIEYNPIRMDINGRLALAFHNLS